MHQLLRVELTGAGTTEGGGAMSASPAERDPIEVRLGQLADLLERLAGLDFDLRVAGGQSIEGPGALVLAVDDADMDRLYEELSTEFRVRRVEVKDRELEDSPGALAAFVRDLANDGLFVNEIYVGTARGGTVPVQISTIRHSEEAATAS
jgi:hypothetical protein